MPPPIRPHPSTPTFLISGISLSELEALADLFGDADERAVARCRQGPVAADLSMLEPVEHLLERDLGALVVRAVAARHVHGGDSEQGALEVEERRDHGERDAAAPRGPRHAPAGAAAPPRTRGPAPCCVRSR